MKEVLGISLKAINYYESTKEGNWKKWLVYFGC
jgi:hypothetical protein